MRFPDLTNSHKKGGIPREYDDEERELLDAILEYRRVNDVGYVGPADVLFVLKKLGWEKVPARRLS